MTQPLFILEDLPANDEWLVEIEDPVLPTDDQWLNDLDRAARRFTGGGENSDGELNDIESMFFLLFLYYV